MRDLSEITEELLGASGFSRAEPPHLNDRGELVVSWRDAGGVVVLDRLEPAGLPWPWSHAVRAALIADLTGECPVCRAVVRPLEDGERFDAATMQRGIALGGVVRHTINRGVLEEQDAAMEEAATEAVEAGGSLDDAIEAAAEAQAEVGGETFESSVEPFEIPPRGELVVEHISDCSARPASIDEMAADEAAD